MKMMKSRGGDILIDYEEGDYRYQTDKDDTATGDLPNIGMLIGDVVIHRTKGTKHIVVDIIKEQLGCGCILTKKIKISDTLLCDRDTWFYTTDFRLFDQDDF